MEELTHRVVVNLIVSAENYARACISCHSLFTTANIAAGFLRDFCRPSMALSANLGIWTSRQRRSVLLSCSTALDGRVGAHDEHG